MQLQGKALTCRTSSSVVISKFCIGFRMATARWGDARAHEHPFRVQEVKAIKLERETKRLHNNAALEERNLKEARFGFRPRCTEVEHLLDKGGELEDAGLYSQAVKCYTRALALEPEHHELRQHIALVNLRLNAMCVISKQQARQEQLSSAMAGESQQLSLHVPSLSRQVDKPRGKANLGYAVPPSPKEYGQALKKQAAQDAAAKERAKQHEAQLDQQVLDAAAAMHAHSKHHRHVHGGNAKLHLQRDMQMQIDQRRQERARQYQLEWENHAAQQPACSPLAGVGERERVAQLARPGSAAGRASAHYRHPQQGRPMSAGMAYGKMSAPFARPGVDYPVARVNPADVRARQQAFYDKHQKLELPVRIGQQHVTPQDHQRLVDKFGYQAQEQRAAVKQGRLN